MAMPFIRTVQSAAVFCCVVLVGKCWERSNSDPTKNAPGQCVQIQVLSQMDKTTVRLLD